MSGGTQKEVEKAIGPIAEGLSGTPEPRTKPAPTPDPDDESGFAKEEKVRVPADADTPPLKVPDTGVS